MISCAKANYPEKINHLLQRWWCFVSETRDAAISRARKRERLIVLISLATKCITWSVDSYITLLNKNPVIILQYCCAFFEETSMKCRDLSFPTAWRCFLRNFQKQERKDSCQDLISCSMAVFCLRFPTTRIDAYSECGQEQYREIYDFKQERCFVLKCCFALEMHNEHNCEIYDFK